jgi:hypothetical protein
LTLLRVTSHPIVEPDDVAVSRGDRVYAIQPSPKRRFLPAGSHLSTPTTKLASFLPPSLDLNVNIVFGRTQGPVS